MNIKLVVKYSLEQTTKAQRGRNTGIQVYSSFFFMARWVVGIKATSRPLYALNFDTLYPLHRRPGGPLGRSERVQNTSPPPGFDPWTVQPVAGHYTD